MKSIRKLFYLIFPCYERVDYIVTTWGDADRLIKEDPNWQIAPEDVGCSYPIVALEKLKRITE